MSLLSMPSTREKQHKQVGEEILELLSKPTAKERSLVEKFKSQGGAQVMEFCPHGTRAECDRQQPITEEFSDENTETDEFPANNNPLDIPCHSATTTNENETVSTVAVNATTSTTTAVSSATSTENNNDIKNGSLDVTTSKRIDTSASTSSNNNNGNNNNNNTSTSSFKCNKLHFKKIIQGHTDESLGDCSFLNTCFHMDTCKYVHYEVDSKTSSQNNSVKVEANKASRAISLSKKLVDTSTALQPPQWIQCDLRYLDMTVLGKFAVIMADPPWDIHMELPYGKNFYTHLSPFQLFIFSRFRLFY